MKTLEIKVGISTEGNPIIEPVGPLTRLSNMRIGLGFHWERTIEALLPGRLEANDDPVYRVVNRLPVETYLACVVGSEMNPAAPVEFLKAHAVISRSWAAGKILRLHPDSDAGKVDRRDYILRWEDTCDHHGFDVCSDDHCQRYQGVQPLAPEIAAALRATEGLVLTSPDGRFRLDGHGWGHGVGLCQIGAARMALAGRDFREILSFYYPGSHLSEI